ncbi:hypothetical protein HQN89_28475 [Paenibacillus frigoriresistens]|uniref:DUF6069 family protein n=1 Tax=Paenibacillus alginolyticus TaxID=59839 RepID=UPI001566D490|nr:DUF6069 family protein [Paenibacillus frigoriresistens]NRF94830.1 hypothetical protein [Paenibacillus frigoriresistens]
MNSTSKQSKRLPFKSYVWKALVAAIITIVLNLILFYIGDANGAFPDQIKVMADNSLQSSNVIMMSLLGTVIGIIIFAAVGSIRAFRIIAVIGFILLIFTPFTVKETTTKFIVYLELMHVVAAVVTVWVASRKIKIQ